MKAMTLLFILISFLCISVQADSTTDFLQEINSVIDDITTPPEEPCHDCAVEENTISNNDPLPTAYKRGEQYFNQACTNFIKDDGSEGPWGKLISDYIEKSEAIKSVFLNDEIKGMTARPYTCPNWYNLNTEQRKRFWLWMFASIAQVESSCDPSKVNTGAVPNPADRPTGLFQLNRDYDNRYWRGSSCRFASGYDETIKITNQVNCSMDIMLEVLKGSDGMYKSNGKIFPAKTYWEKLRPNHSQTGGPIGELVRKYPPCNATP